MEPTRYTIVAHRPSAHLFEVACTIDDPAHEGHRFVLPSWIPGSYLIREFARHVVAARAHDARGPVRLAKVAKDTWQAAPAQGALTVTIDVYAHDVSVRTAFLDATRGYFNGPGLFLLPEGRARAACIVDLAAPTHAGGERWRVATTLPRDGAEAWGFGRYRAASYDELIDHPVEMADFQHVAFEAGGVTHDVAVSGRARFDGERLARDLAKVCQWQCDLFGGAPGSRAPFDRYLFQVMAVGEGYGGLEHRASTSLLCSRRDLPAPGMAKITDDYRAFLGLASHEYFHAWNVKRIKPAAFVPYDLAREAYTRQLWAFEGITSYYDDLALVRSGVIDAESYLELLGRAMTGVLRTPGRAVQSVADASFDAWIKHYRPDENTPNACVSYYAKGSLVALALDLSLRQAGGSLDAVMRALWRSSRGGPIGEPDILAAVEAAADRALARELQQWVHGTADLPLQRLLEDTAITVLHETTPLGAGLGLKLSEGALTGIQVKSVALDSAAARAGISAGDEVLAVDGWRVRRLDEALQWTVRDRPLELVLVRERRLHSVRLRPDVRSPLRVQWRLALSDGAPKPALARRRSWLGR